MPSVTIAFTATESLQPTNDHHDQLHRKSNSPRQSASEVGSPDGDPDGEVAHARGACRRSALATAGPEGCPFIRRRNGAETTSRRRRADQAYAPIVCKRLVAVLFVLIVGVLPATVQAEAASAADPAAGELVNVLVQDEGTFDRVTFVFGGTVPPNIRRAEYVSRPVFSDPSGMEVPVGGSAVIRIAMDATGFDIDGNPTYTGPLRIQPGLPNVVDLIELGDFERVLSWGIGVRTQVEAQASVLAEPPRVIVDIPHVARPVSVQPSFTG
jgi:hypothetical protein